MDLLEYLAEKLHCDFISNLRYRTLQPEEETLLRTFPAELFTPAQYAGAIRYILGGAEVELPATPQEGLERLISAFPRA